MFTISKEFSFSASHVLSGLPDDHPCGRVHGHNYVVSVELGSTEGLDEVGFVRDYRALEPIKKWLDETVDHRHLNDVLDGVNPSAEHLSRWIFETWQKDFPEITAVRLSETPKTWAEYRPRKDRLRRTHGRTTGRDSTVDRGRWCHSGSGDCRQ